MYHGQIGYFLARLGDWKCQCLDVVKNLVIWVQQSWVQILTHRTQHLGDLGQVFVLFYLSEYFYLVHCSVLDEKHLFLLY